VTSCVVYFDGYARSIRNVSPRRSFPGVSEVVACFETVRSSAPGRTLLYMPATGAEWSADALWEAHKRYAERFH